MSKYIAIRFNGNERAVFEDDTIEGLEAKELEWKKKIMRPFIKEVFWEPPKPKPEYIPEDQKRS